MEKRHILSEIKRTAEANGGIPLGHRRFYQETGIKEFDWRGKFWARWGDALREAGFAPNLKQGAYEESLLIEKYIALVRELQHFPTIAEMRLKARSDPGFPNEKTFARLGSSKPQIATKIRDYCRDRDGYADVLSLCSPILGAAVAARHDDHKRPAREECFGFVYLIKSGRHYKIGSTNAIGRREYELSIQLPEKAVLLHEIRTDDPIGIEAYWHRRFASKRKGGEWFELNADDVRAFRRRKFM